jgi:methyl-accepting chemotaxis protein
MGSIRARINMLIVLAVVCQIGASAYQLLEYRNGIWTQRGHELTSVAALAVSIVDSEYASAQSGTLSTEAAQREARQRVAALRYGNGDYFLVIDTSARMIMHPIKPALNGQDLSDYKDPTGKPIFAEMAALAKRSGSGFEAYRWPKPGKETPQPKLSYVTEFMPWGWILGTGVYVDDLDDLFVAQLKTQGGLVLAVIASCTFVSFLMGRGLARSLAEMTDRMARLAGGDLAMRIETRTGARELDQMAAALVIFQINAIEKFQINAIEKVRGEAAALAEREQSEALRQKAAREAIEAERARGRLGQARGQGFQLSAHGSRTGSLSAAARRSEPRV